MERYNYLEHMTEDIAAELRWSFNAIEWAKNMEDRDQFESDLYDQFFTDGITGNDSGSYYCNAWKAEEALAHNWDLLADAIEEFGGDVDILRQGPEACDVTIRCYLLGQAITAAVDLVDAEYSAENPDTIPA